MKRKRPVVEFITMNRHIAEMFPPVPAARMMPDWWRNTPSFITPEHRRFPHLKLRRDATVKGCPGIYDFMSLGWILPLWADLVVEADETGFSWESSCSNTEVTAFNPPELGGNFPRQAGDHTHVLKILTPWQVKAASGWSLMVLPPLYHAENRWQIMPGVVDSDRLPVLNIVAEWRAPIGRAELMKAGTPLLHIVPFHRQELPTLTTSVLDKNEWHQRLGGGINAVEGLRLAPGTYREHKRHEEATFTPTKE